MVRPHSWMLGFLAAHCQKLLQSMPHWPGSYVTGRFEGTYVGQIPSRERPGQRVVLQIDTTNFCSPPAAVREPILLALGVMEGLSSAKLIRLFFF